MGSLWKSRTARTGRPRRRGWPPVARRKDASSPAPEAAAQSSGRSPHGTPPAHVSPVTVSIRARGLRSSIRQWTVSQNSAAPSPQSRRRSARHAPPPATGTASARTPEPTVHTAKLRRDQKFTCPNAALFHIPYSCFCAVSAHFLYHNTGWRGGQPRGLSGAKFRGKPVWNTLLLRGAYARICENLAESRPSHMEESNHETYSGTGYSGGAASDALCLQQRSGRPRKAIDAIGAVTAESGAQIEAASSQTH